MKTLKRLFKGLLFLPLGLVVLAVSLLALAQTNPGRLMLAGMINEFASSPAMGVRVEGVAVGWGLNASVERLILSDEQGEWLKASKLSLQWQPAALLRGMVDVKAIGAAEIDVLRRPVPPPADEAEAPSESGSVPLFPFRIADLAIGRISLQSAVIGAPVELTLSGKAAAEAYPAAIDASLAIHRIDEVDGELSATARFRPEDETLEFSLQLREPREGLAARLLEIADLPALDLSLSGEGPLDDWKSELAVSLDGRKTVSGTARLTRNEKGRALAADLDGDVAALAPPVFDALLLGQTKFLLDAQLSEDFAPLAANLSLSTDTLDLTGQGGLNPDSRNLAATLDMTLSAGGDALIALELQQRRIMIGETKLHVELSGTQSAANWKASLSANRFSTIEAAVDRISLEASGENADLDPAALTLPYRLSLTLSNAMPADADLKALAGDVRLKSEGIVNGAQQSAAIRSAVLELASARLSLANAEVSAEAISAEGDFALSDLARFASLAKRPIAGSLSGTFSASGDPGRLSGAGKVDLTAKALQTGIAQADALLAGETKLTVEGGYSPDAGLDIGNLKLAGDGLMLSASGTSDFNKIEAAVDLALSRLERIDERLSGSIVIKASAEGPLDAARIKADIASDDLKLTGKAVEELRLSVDVVASATKPTGSIDLSGGINGKPIKGSVKLASDTKGLTADAIEIVVGANRIAGSLATASLDAPIASLTGRLTIDAPDLAEVGPLLLTELSGKLQGSIDIASEDGKPVIRTDIGGSGIATAGVSVETLTAKATVYDPLGGLRAEGTVSAGNLAAGGQVVERLSLNARNAGARTDFDLDARLKGGTGKDGIALAGFIELAGSRMNIALNRLDGQYAGLETNLGKPARLAVESGTLSIETLALSLGSGSLTVSGSAGEKLDLAANFNAVPLALANAFSPDLGLAGSASGKAKVTGSPSNPTGSWTVDLAGVGARVLRDNGIPALTVASTGSLKGQKIDQKTVVTGPSALSLTASGTASLNQPISVDVKVAGFVPVELAREKLTRSGLSARGGARIEASVSGPVTGLRFSGSVTPQDLQITELGTGMTLREFTGTIALANNGVELRQIRASLATGGTLTANGRIGLESGFPAQVEIALVDGRYMDGTTVQANLDAALDLSGPLADPARGASLSGSVTIRRADITIPDRLPGAVSPVAVTHVNAPPAVRQQTAALQADAGGSDGGAAMAPISLDVTVSAPNQIFVRGRGLDAELGGQLKLVGTTRDPQAIGGFSLIRGRIQLLSKQLTFNKGIITFTGSLMPRLDFEATTSTSTSTITIAVRGNADAPDITLSSAPELPQDEILARLLFDQSLSNLSPAQIAQLAASVATLTGGSGKGPLGRLRQSLGLDAINITDGGKSGPAVTAGKYINDNIYLGVTQGSGSDSSRVTVDIDVSKNLKLRGEVGANGETKAGIFFEREY